MSLLVKRGNALPSVFNNLFDNFFKDDFLTRSFVGNSTPAVNVIEDKDHFRVQLAVPGMTKNDFRIDLDQNVLTISCEKKSEEEKVKKQYTRREFNFSSFQRSFTLPEHVNKDKIDASYKEGILSITLLKKAEAQKAIARQIKIS